MAWEAKTLWDCLDDRQVGDYTWKREVREVGKCYVCYLGEQEISFIPIAYNPKDVEWKNWWKEAYDRHPGGLTTNILMEEIMDRHRKIQ